MDSKVYYTAMEVANLLGVSRAKGKDAWCISCKGL